MSFVIAFCHQLLPYRFADRAIIILIEIIPAEDKPRPAELSQATA
ncbi:MAG: hypothetical protein WBH01_08685 [Dehalococcoidia bacterium]